MVQRIGDRRSRALGVLLATALAFGACGSDEPDTGATTASGSEATTGEQGDLPVVRISGLERGLAGVAIKAMDENGFDESNGFQGEFTYLGFDALEPDFLQGGADISFGLGDPIAVATARNEGFAVTHFYPFLTQNICIVVMEDSPYQSIEDLVGERVGHFGEQSGTTTTFAILLAEYADIDVFEDFEMIEAGKPALVELLQRGEVDAMMNSAPDTSRALAEGGRCLFGPANQEMEERGGELEAYLGMLTVHEPWLEENRDLAIAVTRAWDDTVAWMQENPSFIAEDPYKELTGQEAPEVLAQLTAEVTEVPLFTNEWNQDVIDAIERFTNLAAEQGTLITENPGGGNILLEN